MPTTRVGLRKRKGEFGLQLFVNIIIYVKTVVAFNVREILNVNFVDLNTLLAESLQNSSASTAIEIAASCSITRRSVTSGKLLQNLKCCRSQLVQNLIQQTACRHAGTCDVFHPTNPLQSIYIPSQPVVQQFLVEQ